MARNKWKAPTACAHCGLAASTCKVHSWNFTAPLLLYPQLQLGWNPWKDSNCAMLASLSPISGILAQKLVLLWRRCRHSGPDFRSWTNLVVIAVVCRGEWVQLRWDKKVSLPSPSPPLVHRPVALLIIVWLWARFCDAGLRGDAAHLRQSIRGESYRQRKWRLSREQCDRLCLWTAALRYQF